MKRVLVSLLILIAAVAIFINFQFEQLKSAQLVLEEPVLFQVRSGMGISSLCSRFKNKGWLDDCFWLKVYGKIFPEQVQLKQGLYQISSGNLLAVISKIQRGDIHQFSFTIIEGATFKQVMESFSKAPNLELLPDAEVYQLIEKMGITQANPEGWFYPETYYYSAGDSQVDILSRAYKKMKATLAELWQERDKKIPLNSPYEALILASIIEKESGYSAEHSLIASVFINRLNKGMRLQTDPTVIYGLGEEYQGDIKSEHLRRYTAYNTYRINGLPPTPIAMSSRQAIYAALNPRYSEFYYFVASGDGQHHFSETLEQHNAAVRKYILNK